MTLMQAAALGMAEDRPLNGTFLPPYEVLDLGRTPYRSASNGGRIFHLDGGSDSKPLPPRPFLVPPSE